MKRYLFTTFTSTRIIKFYKCAAALRFATNSALLAPWTPSSSGVQSSVTTPTIGISCTASAVAGWTTILNTAKILLFSSTTSFPNRGHCVVALSTIWIRLAASCVTGWTHFWTTAKTLLLIFWTTISGSVQGLVAHLAGGIAGTTRLITGRWTGWKFCGKVNSP